MPISTPEPRRRWYRFSLRTLLVAMVLLLVLCGGWLMYRRQQGQAKANRERLAATERAIAWIEEVGGQHDATTKRIRSQTWLEEWFDDPGGADDPTVAIVVSQVSLDGTRVTDADLVHLTESAGLAAR